MKTTPVTIDRVNRCFNNAELGDPRRTRRVQIVAARLAEKPSVPLPAAMRTSAELEAAYRIVNNPHVTFERLIESQAKETAARARRAGRVLAIHDTTPCSFPHMDAQELGYLTTGQAGFPLHLSLVIDARDWRRPLGVVHAEALYRPKRNKAKRRSRSKSEPREFDRWQRGIAATSSRLKDCDEVIHIADCETDSYELFANQLDAGERFIFRVRVADRRVGGADTEEGSWTTVRQLARSCEGMLERDVPLSDRKKHKLANQSKAHPPRNSRIAKLRFAATTVVLPRPHRLGDPFPKTLTLNLVHVLEIDPPQGEPAVEWMLYATEPIDTPEQVAHVVDMYRARWTIEEFNAALKIGCAYEARQLETRDALLTMLAISLPVACEMLRLRSLARTDPEAQATDVLNTTQLKVLRVLGRSPLPEHPTARDALLAVAALGGHVKANGDPGWKVLYRGMMQLTDYCTAWVAGASERGSHL